MNITQLIQEHESQNAVYLNGKTELPAQPDPTDPTWVNLAEERLDALMKQLSSITDEELTDADSYVQNVDALVSLFDDVILECVLLTKKRAAVEEMILNHIKTAISEPTKNDKRNREDEHVVSNLIDGLVMSELPLVLRSTTMTSALLHDTNPLRLGLTYFRIFCNKYPNIADMSALNYLNDEEEAHRFLLSGQNGRAAEFVAKLFDSAVKSPEKYLLMALNSFYSGFENDAVRALELGLEAFPGNLRLSDAKEGLLGI